jgi:hypothetical protein
MGIAEHHLSAVVGIFGKLTSAILLRHANSCVSKFPNRQIERTMKAQDGKSHSLDYFPMSH